MCLAIPGKIIKIIGEKGVADFNGIQKEINVSLIKASLGEYVIVHAGFAIEKVDEEEAKKTYEFMEK